MAELSALWFISGLTCGAFGVFFVLFQRLEDRRLRDRDRRDRQLDERFSQLEAHWDAQLNDCVDRWRSESGQWHAATYQATTDLSDRVDQYLAAIASPMVPRPDDVQGEEPYEEPSADPLASAVGIDYQPLNDALGQGHWKAANDETRRCLLLACGRRDRGWLSLEDWQTVPAIDWQTMDGLWRYWSGDRLGFWPQWQLWQQSGGDYGAFCDLTHWRQNGEDWRDYDDLWFSADATAGHLPAATWSKRSCYGIGAESAGRSLEALLYAYAAAIGAIPT